MPEESKTRVYLKSFVLGGLVVVGAAIVWLIMADQELNQTIRTAPPASSQTAN